MAELYAHRGAAAELPENTLEAFARALEVGANAIETDAHMTRDGHVVLSHDATGARRAGTARAICDATLDEVKRWDVGRGLRVPTLAEALAAFPDVRFNVDAKQRRPDMTAALVEAIRRAGAEPRVLVASFDVRTLRRVRRTYRGATGLAQAEVIALLALPSPVLRAVRLAGSAAQLPHRYGPIDLGKRSVVDKCHALGLVVHYWTVNDVARAKELLAIGADGIMTDDPRAIAPAFSAAALPLAFARPLG